MTTIRLSLLAALALASCAAPTGRRDSSLLPGFPGEKANAQRALEERFDAHLKADNLRAWLRRMAGKPHHVGSPHDKANVDFMAAKFKSWGYETKIEEFKVLFPTPKTRMLQMTAPTSFKAALAPDALTEDSTSAQADTLPIYNAYSVDGDVTGELVYVNFGVPGDYEILERHGIDVKGKIVIARYYGSWRGIKPKVAAEHGAIGCILYSDPHEDGYFQGDVYPKGAFKNSSGGQRGSVVDMPLYPGDPLTPGVGATADAKRIPIKESPTLTKIPVLPISYSDALPLLKAMDGPVAPEAWRGALPVTYHLGPGRAKVRLKLEFNWNFEPAYNVIARMPGSDRPDQWIVRGNHHDAWVHGAQDPVSGMVALMEEARAISELRKSGWRPRRTIVFCAWGAEEPGLLGSTEWAEAHATELKNHAAVYINSDSNGRGFLRVGGSHSLENLVNGVARDVPDPQLKMSVAKRLRALRLSRATGKTRRDVRERENLAITALGSGSDYTAFIDHLGVASLNIGFGGENRGGSYHTIYDSIDHYERFGDPDYSYGVALAKTCGRLVLRLANADALPFEFTPSAETIARYAREVAALAETMKAETEAQNRLIREGSLKAAADPKKPYVVPEPKDAVPDLDFGALKRAVARLDRSASRHDATRRAHDHANDATLDEVLMKTERALTRSEGLPRRPWYKHFIYAPGFYTGYGVKTLPAIREAIEQRNWDEAREQIAATAETIERYAAEIDRATGLLR